jgi:hypothetical protein
VWRGPDLEILRSASELTAAEYDACSTAITVAAAAFEAVTCSGS